MLRSKKSIIIFLLTIILFSISIKIYFNYRVQNVGKQYDNIAKKIPFDFMITPSEYGSPFVFKESAYRLPSAAGFYWQQIGEKKYVGCTGEQIYFYNFNLNTINYLNLNGKSHCRFSKSESSRFEYYLEGNSMDNFEYIVNVSTESLETIPQREIINTYEKSENVPCETLQSICVKNNLFSSASIAPSELASMLNTKKLKQESVVAMKNGYVFFVSTDSDMSYNFFNFPTRAYAGLVDMYLNIYSTNSDEIFTLPEPFKEGMYFSNYITFL